MYNMSQHLLPWCHCAVVEFTRPCPRPAKPTLQDLSKASKSLSEAKRGPSRWCDLFSGKHRRNDGNSQNCMVKDGKFCGEDQGWYRTPPYEAPVWSLYFSHKEMIGIFEEKSVDSPQNSPQYIWETELWDTSCLSPARWLRQLNWVQHMRGCWNVDW